MQIKSEISEDEFNISPGIKYQNVLRVFDATKNQCSMTKLVNFPSSSQQQISDDCHQDGWRLHQCWANEMLRHKGTH